MISVNESSAIIQSTLYTPTPELVDIENSSGKILAETIYADRDLPPFNRATMDGIAIDAKAVQEGARSFLIEGIQAAGQPAVTLTSNQNCFEIMTGAMLPLGANAVVRYEDIEIKNSTASIKINDVRVGDHVQLKGIDANKNSILLTVGTTLFAPEIALLASVGKPQVLVFSYPRIAIISTGDELVAIHEKPLPYQIRTSNSYALQAALAEIGCRSNRLHLVDDEQTLKNELEKIIIHHDVIILSGGVSKGKFDFVPTVLESLGIKKLFHQVSQKPGKPMWFGCSSPIPRRGAGGEVWIFALPGNPVSTFMCFHRYVKPWLLKSLGVEVENQQAILASDFSFKPALTYFLQVKAKNEGGRLMAYPIAGGGSGDFVNLKAVNGFLELPAERSEFKAGEAYSYIPFRV